MSGIEIETHKESRRGERREFIAPSSSSYWGNIKNREHSRRVSLPAVEWRVTPLDAIRKPKIKEKTCCSARIFDTFFRYNCTARTQILTHIAKNLMQQKDPNEHRFWMNLLNSIQRLINLHWKLFIWKISTHELRAHVCVVCTRFSF